MQRRLELVSLSLAVIDVVIKDLSPLQRAEIVLNYRFGKDQSKQFLEDLAEISRDGDPIIIVNFPDNLIRFELAMNKFVIPEIDELTGEHRSIIVQEMSLELLNLPYGSASISSLEDIVETVGKAYAEYFRNDMQE